MDFRHFILYIHEHYLIVAGTTLSFFFTTAMILLIRSIGSKSESSDSGAGLDVEVIEDAMKRVLSTQPISIAAGSSVAPTPSSSGGEASPSQNQLIQDLQLLVQSRDAQIEKLNKELADAKAGAGAAAGASSDATADSPVDGALRDEIKMYKAKIEELQARLAEYEIIEDDIADLSMFKEENARLKEEVAQMKGRLASAAEQAASALASPAAAAAVAAVAEGAASAPVSAEAEVADLEAELASIELPAETEPTPEAPPEALSGEPTATDEANSTAELKFEKSDSLALDPDDQVMKDFAAAVQANSEGAQPTASKSAAESAEPAQAEDPLAGMINADQIISEVETLSQEEQKENQDSGSAMEETLDTDKLLAEVSSLKEATPAGQPEEDLLAAFDKKSAAG